MTSARESPDRNAVRPRNRCRPRIAATAALLTAAAVAAGSRTAAPAPPEPVATLEVVFSPTQGPGALRNRLAREIREARRSLDIALYTGMTAETARAVAARSSSGCPVRVLIDADALACDPDGNERKSREDDPGPRWHVILTEAGVTVRVMPTAGNGNGDRPVFHHKFAVVDAGTVITGSYNWSARGDGANYENLVVIRDAALAGRFAEEFERLWAAAAVASPQGKEKKQKERPKRT